MNVSHFRIPFTSLNIGFTILVLLFLSCKLNGQSLIDTITPTNVEIGQFNTTEQTSKSGLPILINNSSLRFNIINQISYLIHDSINDELTESSIAKINHVKYPSILTTQHSSTMHTPIKSTNLSALGGNWCFGDSALVDFSDTTNIITSISNIISRGSCASISDSLGNLQFYAGYDDDVYVNGGPPFLGGEIWTRFNQTMAGGDSVVMGLWYHEVLIIPDPGNINLYYVFSIGVTGSYGLYYSIVDMSANGGLGEVISKNQQLQSFQMVDCLNAVKHGNGRDWWIFTRKLKTTPLTPNNEFKLYLITPVGIDSLISNIGSLISTNIGNICFNSTGTKFAFTNYKGLLELYDFDRCTGLISNPVTIYPENTQWPWKKYWGLAFSPNDSLLYVTNIPEQVSDTSRLYQFDLTSTNIAASVDTLWETDFSQQLSNMKLAPDGKIYISANYYGGYPYSDTTFNTTNMNLSVINSPNSLGSACDLQPFSFYLGGSRTYSGLPNNPDYYLGPVMGSICDTLTSLSEQSEQTIISNVYPNPNNGLFSVNYFLSNGKSGAIEVYNIQGGIIYKNSLKPHTYTHQINIKGSPSGVYAIKLTSGRHTVYKKFIIF